ncbi:MAG: S-layer homology domain-containing protein [Clostridiales bacterium]|jgi:hypothetical protein|nr:S-layer homology domain-containing protein [Clostridiales bacterium]
MKTIGKKAISLVCVLTLTFSLCVTTALAATQAEEAAEKLYGLGLLLGIGTNSDGTPDFALDKSATRGEAVTEIVRLLGKESAALTGYHSSPFADVPDWAKPYVGYGYANGFVMGYSPATFGTDNPVTAAHYLTFLLRVMGYRDDADFNWDTTYILSDKLGITNGEFNISNASSAAGFTRGNMAAVTLNALAAPIKPGTRGATASSPKTLLKSLLDDGAVTQTAIDAANLDNALKVDSGDNEPTPAFAPVLAPGRASSSGGNLNPVLPEEPAETPAAPALIGSYSIDGVNYALLAVSDGNEIYIYKIDGVNVAASKVLTKSGSSLYKIEFPEGSAGGTLTAYYNGARRASHDVTFQSAGAAAPKTLYGVVPMKFSEFFHDVTGDNVPDAPDATEFTQDGTVTAPRLFIAQGTRTGGNSSITYADAKDLPKVDVISSATFGDSSVHFVPDVNLANNGDRTAPAADFAMTGITSVEVGVSFDLYANAKLLEAAGQATGQSASVLAALEDFTLITQVARDGEILAADGQTASDLGVYRVKYLLTDGNWGGRVDPADGAVKAVKPLPGGDAASADAETVSYGGNWGDKVTGYVIDALEDEYTGNNYWTNFANYFYAGYITDESGHTEPLVFLQNIFTHMAHTDFDIAVSPSRFDRFADLAPYGTYQVKILAWGFRDIDFEIEMKDFVNGDAALSGGTSVQVTDTDSPLVFTVMGVEKYEALNGALRKGAAAIDSGDYDVSETGGAVTLTLNASLLAGSYQGAYTLDLAAETDTAASKRIAFTLINPVRPLLTTGSALTAADATEDSPLFVSKTENDGKLYFDNLDFAASIVTAGRMASSVAPAEGGAAVAGALKNDGAGSPYYIDLSLLSEDVTYVITAISTGFNTQAYYVKVTA